MPGDSPMGTFFVDRANRHLKDGNAKPVNLHLYTIPGEGDLSPAVVVLTPKQYKQVVDGTLQPGDNRQKKQNKPGAGRPGGGTARPGAKPAANDDSDLFND